MTTSQLRDGIKDLSPPWLQDGVGEKFLYDIGLGEDVVLEKLNQGAQAHMPGRGDPTAIPLLAADRLLLQGPIEPIPNFEIRLQKAFEAWQRAGSKRGVLGQVLAYLQVAIPADGHVPAGAIAGGHDSDQWDVYCSDADITGPTDHVVKFFDNWDWDGHGERWWRCWLVVYLHREDLGRTGAAASVALSLAAFATVSGLTGMVADDFGRFLTITGAATSTNNGTFQIAEVVNSTTVFLANPIGTRPSFDANNGAISWSVSQFPVIAPAPALGTPGIQLGDPRYCLGFNQPGNLISGVRSIVSLWKSAQTYYPWIIFSFADGDGSAGSEFSPNSTEGAGNPDGTWKNWSKIVSGSYVPARVTGVAMGHFDAFVAGTGRYQNAAEQNVT